MSSGNRVADDDTWRRRVPEHVSKVGKHVRDVGHDDCGCDGSEILPQWPVRQEDNAAADVCSRLEVSGQP